MEDHIVRLLKDELAYQISSTQSPTYVIVVNLLVPAHSRIATLVLVQCIVVVGDARSWSFDVQRWVIGVLNAGRRRIGGYDGFLGWRRWQRGRWWLWCHGLLPFQGRCRLRGRSDFLNRGIVVQIAFLLGNQ